MSSSLIMFQHPSGDALAHSLGFLLPRQRAPPGSPTACLPPPPLVHSSYWLPWLLTSVLALSLLVQSLPSCCTSYTSAPSPGLCWRPYTCTGRSQRCETSMPAPCVSTTCWAGASLLSSQVSCLLPRDPLPLGPGSTFMHVSQTHSSGPKNSFPLYLDNLVSGVRGWTSPWRGEWTDGPSPGSVNFDASITASAPSTLS